MQLWSVVRHKKPNTPGQRSREGSGVHPGHSLSSREEAVWECEKKVSSAPLQAAFSIVVKPVSRSRALEAFGSRRGFEAAMRSVRRSRPRGPLYAQTIWNDRLAVVGSCFSREKTTVADLPPRSIAG